MRLQNRLLGSEVCQTRFLKRLVHRPAGSQWSKQFFEVDFDAILLICELLQKLWELVQILEVIYVVEDCTGCWPVGVVVVASNGKRWAEIAVGMEMYEERATRRIIAPWILWVSL